MSSSLTDPRDLERPKREPAAVIESTGGLSFSPDFASLGARFFAWLIETVITVALMVPGALLVLSEGGSPVGVLGVFVAFGGFVVAGALYARSVASKGRWIGGRIASTRVVHVTTGEMIPASYAFTRFVMRALISPVLLFGFLMAVVDPHRRAFHDHIAGTVVTGKARATWSVHDKR